jgi:hypothetical protein
MEIKRKVLGKRAKSILSLHEEYDEVRVVYGTQIHLRKHGKYLIRKANCKLQNEILVILPGGSPAAWCIQPRSASPEYEPRHPRASG